MLDTGQFGHCLTTGQSDHCLTTGQFSHCLTTGLFREPTHNSHWHTFGHIETWAQRDVGTKRRGHKIPLFWGTDRRGHKIPLFWAYRDVGTKRRGHKRRGHKETWAQRDASGKKKQHTLSYKKEGEGAKNQLK